MVASRCITSIRMFFNEGGDVISSADGEYIQVFDSFNVCDNTKVHDSGQRESFFQSRDENESFSDSISFIETRPRIPDTYSQASRRDREKISSNLGHRDEIEIYYLHSQASRREREFP